MAALSRQKELPKLKDVLDTEEKRKVMTDEEIMNMAKMLNAAFGGNFVEA